MLSDTLKAEARAFDARIEERIRHGHIPDLRKVEPCDWFFNNPWRRPYTVDLDFGRAFRFALGHARRHRLLEVGSGVGHMSLEFGRNGFNVTGLEIASGCIGVAERLLAENPYREGFGSVDYVNDDFLSWDPGSRRFDSICFFGTLHHFADVEGVVARAQALLEPGGTICVLEPARDWTTEANGAAMALIRILLGTRGGWFEPQELPQTEAAFREQMRVCLHELRDGHDEEETEQSPNDNSSAAEGMLVHLRGRFEELECRRLNGFLQRMIGGVRGSTEEETRQLANFIDVVDQVFLQLGMMPPAEMYWAGRKV